MFYIVATRIVTRLIPAFLPALIFSVLISGCYNRPKAPEHLRIIFTSDIRGVFTPYGCSGEMMGGMARLATAVKEAVEESPWPVLVLDTGNFSGDGESGLNQLKASYIANTMQSIGYDAVNVGYFEARNPLEKILSLDPDEKMLTSVGYTHSHEGEERVFSYMDRMIVGRDGFRIAIIGHPLDDIDASATGENNVPDMDMRELYDKIGSIFTTDNVQMLIMISDVAAPLEEVNFRAKMYTLASLVIGGIPAKREGVEEKRGQEVQHPLVIPHAEPYGKSFGILDLDLSRTGGIIGYKLQYRNLDASVEDDSGIVDQIKKYIAETGEPYQNSTEISPEGFVGAQSCRQCHTKEYEQWETSAHSKAWMDSETMNSLRDPSCVACHATGFSSTDTYPPDLVDGEFRGVGCESCHGPGESHYRYQTWKSTGKLEGVESPDELADIIIPDPTESMCQACHRPPNDENWVYSIKRSRILHE